MKRQLLRFTFFLSICLTLSTLNQTVVANSNVGEPRTVRLFYFLPNDRPNRADVVESMKTGILEVQSFYAEQMAAHGHGYMTFNIETDARGVPIVHTVNGDHGDSHYKDRGRPENEISREFDISSIVQLVVMDISRSSSGRGTGIKQRGQAIIDGRWDWRTAAHELGHAFGLQHDFRDTSYIMSYGSGRNSLSAGAAKYLAVNPYINHSIPLQAGAAPSVQLLSSSQYSYGATSVPVQVRVRDADGLQQVTLFVKTPQGVNLPTGYNEVVSYRNLSGQTDTTVTFNYKGRLPSKGDDDTSLLAQLRHTIYVSAVDKQGNRIDAPPAWTLQPINIQPAKVPVSTRSPRVRDSIYNVVRLFHDRSVSAYDHITDAHLAEIDTLFVNNIDGFDNRLKSDDFDGLTNLENLRLNYSGITGSTIFLPFGIFEGLTSLSRLSSARTFQFIVRLEKVGEDQFKAVAPNGAPFDIELPLTLANGSISGGTTTITIPKGSIESAPVTVTRTPGTTFAVTVDIEKFPSLPTGHEGYYFVKGQADLGPILKIFDALPGSFTHLNDRTPQVRDAIVKAVPEIETPDLGKERRVQIGDTGFWYTETITYGYYANFVTEAHLAAITSLDLSNAVITALKEGDFDGLTNLTTLNLGGNDLRSLIPPIIEGIYLTPIFRKPSEIFDELTNLTTLDLSGNKLSSLPSGVFDELTNLTGLNLANNDLSSLSEDIFDELTNLTGLNLANNDLSSLPAGVFDELTNLTFLNLASNDLSSLPEDIFDELTNMIGISLSENQLSSLLAGIFDELTNMIALDLSENQLSSLSGGIFNQITNLVSLDLRANQLSSLPDGIFEDHFDLSAAQTGYQILLENSLDSTGSESDTLNLTVLLLNDNLVNPIPLTVSLVHVTDDQFKAVAPSGAPFDIVLPLTVTNGSISGSATSITIPTGSVDSQPLTVTRTPGTTAAATVDIGAPLPGLPDGHSGYALVKSVAPPLEFIELEGRVFTPVSERTPEVRDAIVDAVPGVNSAADVTAAHLAAIPSFEVSLGSSVKVGDFDGLTGVTGLGLETGQLTSLPAGLFNDLSNVTYMEWGSQKLITLPVGAFQGFTNLENFGWGAIGLTSLPAGVLDPLTNLTALGITAPQLNTLPDGIFDNLTNLTHLDLHAGQLRTLSDDIFDQLTKLTTLRLTGTQLANLPDGVFDRLTALTELDLSDNQLSTLPDGLFFGLSSLTKLHLDGNTADPLPLTVSLEKVGVGQFKAVAPAGAPFDLILPINVTDGSINGGVTTLMISAGSVESDDTLTVSHTPNATEAVAVDIGTLPGLPTSVDRYSRRLHQGYTLVKSVGLPLEFGELGGSVFTPVTDRTPQVRDLIVKAVPGVDSAADVTKAHLAAIPVFWLGQIELFGEPGGEEITTLQAGDFDGLTGLTFLWVSGGEQLSNVPDGIFDGLSSLETLSLIGNFSNLPEGVFDDLTALTTLIVISFQLNSLPAGVFNELTALTALKVVSPLNSLPADIFDGLTALTTLSLTVDDTLMLPAGIFEGFTALTDLVLTWAKFSEITLEEEAIVTDPRPLTVSLEKIGTDQFKAVAPMGATFNMVLPVTVTNGSINGVTRTTLTIPTGSVESDTLTVNRTPGSTYATTIHIGTLPSLPQNHSGYTLVKSVDLPLTFTELSGQVFTSVGNRTPQVRDAIVAAVPGVNSANDVTEAHLAAIQTLHLYNKNITTLKEDDFSGLSALMGIDLTDNELTTLPAGVFNGLSALKVLVLTNNNLSSLPDGVFNDLSALTSLWLAGNELTTLPAGVFNGLSALESLALTNNNLSSLPDGVFNGLSALTFLNLAGNAVDPLPFIVSLEKVAEGQFKAVAPAGAPFEIVLPISVTNGSINSGATSITIPSGSVESDTLTVNRTPGSTYATTIHIGTLPSLPQRHSGYSLVKSDDLPITVIEGDIPDNSVLTLTVGAGPGAALRGYNPHSLPDWNFGSLSSPTFVLNGVSYTLHRLYYSVAGKRLDFQTSPMLRGFELHLDSHLLRSFSALDYNLHQWNNVNLNWSVGQKVQVRVVETTPMPPGAPTNLTATPSYEKVTLSWEPPTNADPTTLPVTEYEFRVSNDGGNTWNPDWDIISSSRSGQSNRTSCTIGDSSHNPNVDDIIDINLTNGTSYTFEIRARGGDGSGDAARITVTPAGSTPVSQRTPQVREAIRGVVRINDPSVSNYTDITETHLTGVIALFLNNKNITALKSGDFDGLTGLEELRLNNNQLATLPAGIFDGLSSLSTLELSHNSLTTLLTGIFDGLPFLSTLELSNNLLTTLPSDIFSRLSSLIRLDLSFNQLLSLPANIFSGLSSLLNLNLSNNQLLNLPTGIFSGLSLQELNLFNVPTANPPPGGDFGTRGGDTDNQQSAVSITISLEQIGEGQFKATVPTGAPFNVVLPLNVTNGTINSGATTLTIPAGSVESNSLTVTRTSGTTFAVTVDIGTLPGLPANHSGYSLVKSADLPLVFSELGGSAFTPISERTPQVRDEIVQKAGVNSANDVTEAHLAAITSLYLLRENITTLKAGDFDGLTALTTLDLAENQLSTLPEGIFDDLTALTQLELHDNQLSTLPADIFDALTALRYLYLHNNQIATLPAGTFDGLSWLDQLFLQGNQLTTLPAGIFDKLTVLRTLNLEDNQLSSLPEGIFDKLTELNYLTLADNRLTTLPADIFDGPSALYDIWLDDNQFATLPVGIFKMKASFLTLRGLYLEDNAVDPLPLTVSLEKVADGQFKAVAPAGATFDFILQISVANGTITGGATSITIPKGSVESDTFTVTRTVGTTADVTVDIGTLPSLPSGHTGYTLVKSTDLPLEVISATATQVISVNIPDANLRAKIETALGKTAGDPITATEMATLTTLNAQDARITNLAGLETATNLTELQLWDNQITNLSALSGLTNLIKLYLWGNNISDISQLSGLTSLTQLRLGENSISNISAVSSLRNLTYLSVKENAISNISAVSGLTNLTQLLIGNNTISDITPVRNLINLTWLDMPNNRISDISVVQNLTQLVELYFQNNAVSDLSPLVANTGLGTDDELDIRGNPLSYPSIYTHIPALQARDVYIDFDNRVAIASLKISGDTQQGAPSTALAQPFVVEVQDANSVVFAGVPVTFAVTAGGGTLSVTSTATNTNGRAESTLILGSSAGTNTVRVSVQGVSQAATFTAEAATTNTAPVFTDGTSTTRAIAENTAAGINIGATIAATDANNDTLTYTLGGTDAASFSISSSTGQLQTKSALDYETKTVYTVTVTVSDGTLTDSITVTINITDVAETPANTGVCQVGDVLAPGESCTYPSTAATFSVHNNGNGQFLFFTSGTALNIVDSAINGVSYTLVAQKLASGSWKIEKIADSAAPATTNTAPTFTEGANTTRTITENVATGVNIGTAIAATDADNDALTYTLGGTDASAFDIDSTTGQLRTRATLDYETKRSYTVTVTVSDGSLTDTITATINVSDIAETPANTGVCEVGDILSPGESCTYPGTDAEFSVLNNGNGQFLFFSSGNSLNIRNTTINGVSYTLVANKLASGSWEIEEIGDSAETRGTTNSAPVFTDGTSTIRSVAENTSANVNIGNAVAATDPENDTLTYTLSGTDAASFDIESTTGQLKTKSALDYETKSTYTVTITVSDSNLTDTITVTINVTNIAETSTATTAINIPDNNLRAKIEAALGKASGAPISAAEMETLTSLTAQDSSISNLTGLEAAMNLTILKLGDNSVSDISPLTGLTKLTELQLWDNAISNISAVAGLTQVTRLYLWGNTISNISAVASLTNLTQLRLGENSISNISALAGLTSLTFLSVKENSISDISAVAGLTNLTELRIGNNAITNISAVAKLTNLVWLDAPNNSISDISAVANLTNLTSLMLTGNTISDISTLTGLTKLVELYFQNNAVSDLSPLVANTGLGTDDELDIRGNPLSYPSIYTHIPALQARDVYIDFDNRVATASLKISGDTQQGAPSTALAQPFVVEVQDGDSATFAGVPVTFAVTAGGGTLSVTSTTTNTNGRAESTLILGSSAGTNTVRVSVQGISQAAIFTAEAATTNTAPVFTDGTSTTRAIAENTAAGINIGATIAATDANNDTLTYTLGGTDAASFSISSSTGQLQTKSALDYETKTVYTVTVTVSDGTLTDSITVTINITDVAETPANTGVCQVGDVLAPGESCTYPSTAATFSVHNNGNGQFLFFTSGSNLNIKNTVINRQSYTLVANKLASGSWKIEEIADSAAPATTNTAPVFTEGASTTRTIAENTAAGVNIGTAVAATDADNDTLTYTLGGTDASAFDIGSTTGQLRTRVTLDYETKSTYTVTVTVSDGSLTDTITVTITVTDVNDTAVVSTLTPVCDRTTQVRDAIVAAVPGVSDCNDVTEAHLAAITRLDLENKNISSLKDGDFDGMTALYELKLQNNQLQTLPANIFSDLSSLRTLYLNNNRLSSLPSTVFSGLSSLSNLYMNNNQLTSLPALVFSGLTSLRQINMHTNLLTTLPVNVFSGLSSLNQISINNNRLTSLPENVFSGRTGLIYLYLDGNRLTSLPANLFSGLSALEQLKFNNNRLSTLPAGLFRGLSSLTWLLVQGNTVNPLPFTVSLEKVGTNQFKATVPVGAPFAMTIPIPVVNGSISGGATTLTIPAGDVESAPLTVTRTLGTTGAVTVDIGTLPGLPTQHQGYELVKSSNLPLTVINVLSNSAPVFTDGTSATRTIAENTASGVNIGSPVSATDANNDTLTYSLSGTDAASFDIDTTNGQLQTQAALDYETKSSYTVTVTVSDGDLTDTITVTVNITDIDELPTNTGVCKVGDILAPGESCTYPGTDATFSVLDNGQAQWNIPDLPPLLQWINQTSISGSLSISTTINGETYHFVAEELSSGSWEIKEIGDSGTQQPDPPEQPQPPVTESDPPTLSASTAAPLTEVTLHEGVVTLTLNDGTYEWASSTIRNAVTVSTGITGVTVRSFDIDRVSDTEVIVELTFDGTDFDTNSTLTFTVGAGAIAGYDGAALTAQVPVTASTESVVASTTSPLTEDTLDGSVVTLTLSGRNYESSGVRIRNAVTVSGIDGVTVGTFDIDRVSDTQVTVELTFDGNISTDGTLTFTVGPGAIAGYNGPALTTQVSVTAATNTAPTFTDGVSTTRTVAENTVANVNVGSAVAATDANNDTLTYTLGGTDANVFSIESTTGQLKTRAALDYETKRTYTVTITVSDGNGGSDSITVTITVTNVVENRAPVFTDGVSTTRSVTENTAARQNIGRTISATDPNGDTLRYNLSGTEAASFRIDGMTGQLRTWAALDYETKRTYTVTVTVSDGSLTDTITVTINVTDVDDTPTLNVSTAVPLTEATLHGSVVTLTLSKKTYHTNWNFVSQNVEVSGITGVTFRRHNVVRVSDTKVTVELEFNGNISTNSTLTFTVGAGAIANYNGPALTAQLRVSSSTESLIATTAAPLTEVTLNGSIVTLTLGGATYHTNWNFVSRSVEVSGITGVRQYHVDRVSDTEVTVELEFNGNINADSTLTFTVGADAIANYNGPAFTAQVPVSANTESLIATTAAPLTEATLDGNVVTEGNRRHLQG